MNRYFVVSNTLEDSRVQEIAHDCYKLRDGVWAIASTQSTCYDVVRQLGMTDSKENDGVVLRVGEFYGLFNPALWDKLAAWSRQ